MPSRAPSFELTLVVGEAYVTAWQELHVMPSLICEDSSLEDSRVNEAGSGIAFVKNAIGE